MINKPTITSGTIIQHKTSHRLAKITDAYYPPDNPFVICLSYRYIDSGNSRSLIDTDLDNFIEKWDVLDDMPTEKEQIPV